MSISDVRSAPEVAARGQAGFRNRGRCNWSTRAHLH